MATLHMEVEAARSTQSNLSSTHDQLTQTTASMTSAVQGLVGSGWIGNSATEFMNEYEQWRSTMTQLLEQLSTLTTRLQNEITEWETMSSKLA